MTRQTKENLRTVWGIVKNCIMNCLGKDYGKYSSSVGPCFRAWYLDKKFPSQCPNEVQECIRMCVPR